MSANPELRLEYQRVGEAGMVRLVARYGDEVQYADKFDIARASVRKRFAEELLAKCPALKRDEVDRELLSIADRVSTTPEPTPTEPAGELDTSHIVRPELFHTPDVSGVAIPVARLVGGKPSGRWELFLRWHGDGKREQRELQSAIELPSGAMLLLHPLPSEPLPTIQPGWTARGRQAWLNRANAPDPLDVFKRVCRQLACYLDFPPEHRAGNTATLALWTIFTYIYPAWTSVPYLSISGPLGSGKSRVFEVLTQLVFRPMQSSNVTAPALFRTLHDTGGTLLLDEAERLRDRSPDAGDLRSILLSGYKRGSPARRLERVGDRFQHLSFDVFGPKAVAGIARLPDALASRCIRLTMFRAGPESVKPRRRIDASRGAWEAVRDDLHALTLEYGLTWLDLAKRVEVCPAMTGRDFELWQPLLALAAWLEECGGSGLTSIVREHAEGTIDQNQDDSIPEADEILLRLLGETIVESRNQQTQAKDLLERAKESDPETFRHYTAKGVAAVLKRYGLKTTKVHGGRRVYARVTPRDLRQVEHAYGVDLGLPSDNVPHVPHVPPTGLAYGTSTA